MANTSVYTVKSGDSLDKIAKQFGFSNWKKLYESGLNAKLRKARPDPDKVKPGDKVVVPGNGLTIEGQKSLDAAIKTIMKRIEAQQNFINSIHDATKAIEKEVEDGIKRIKKTTDAIDAAQSIFDVSRNIGKVTQNTLKMANAGPKTVQALNNNSAKEVTKMTLSPVKIAASKIAQKNKNTSNEILKNMYEAMNIYTWGSSWSTAYLVGINLSDGAFIRQAKEGKLKDASMTFFQCFGKHPADEMRKRVRQQKLQDVKVTKKLYATLKEDQDLVLQLHALRK